MSYATHAAIAQDAAVRARITACAAQEAVTDPPRWTAAVAWHLPTSEWVAAWDSAVAAGIPDPGADPAVITDPMILSAVQNQRGRW